jgi:hypothetical protein
MGRAKQRRKHVIAEATTTKLRNARICYHCNPVRIDPRGQGKHPKD